MSLLVATVNLQELKTSGLNFAVDLTRDLQNTVKICPQERGPASGISVRRNEALKFDSNKTPSYISSDKSMRLSVKYNIRCKIYAIYIIQPDTTHNTLSHLISQCD